MVAKIGIDDAMEQLKSPGLGFDRVEHIPGSTYKDNSTVIVVPTRGATQEQPVPMFAQPVVSAWQSLIAPMNQKRAMLFTSGHEVGQGYNALIQMILGHPELSKWKYILTLEDDNIPPPDAHIRLLESIEWGKYDAVSALYFTKGESNMPMAYGDPAEFARTGALDFKPRNVKDALAAGQILPVNGIACGCALWRMDLFREIPAPWFVTVNDVVPGKGVQCFTQDLYYCERAVRAGKRFAVDLRVKVGHLDVNTGVVY
jgi:GT2 family glycosyltransferase